MLPSSIHFLLLTLFLVVGVFWCDIPVFKLLFLEVLYYKTRRKYFYIWYMCIRQNLMQTFGSQSTCKNNMGSMIISHLIVIVIIYMIYNN